MRKAHGEHGGTRVGIIVTACHADAAITQLRDVMYIERRSTSVARCSFKNSIGAGLRGGAPSDSTCPFPASVSNHDLSPLCAQRLRPPSAVALIVTVNCMELRSNGMYIMTWLLVYISLRHPDGAHMIRTRGWTEDGLMLEAQSRQCILTVCVAVPGLGLRGLSCHSSH